MLDRYGLHSIVWHQVDERFGEVLVASVADVVGRRMRCTVDGFVSGQPWECWGSTPNLVSIERSSDPCGSSLVSAIQASVGADVDGLMGSQTVRCLQAWLNTGAIPAARLTACSGR